MFGSFRPTVSILLTLPTIQKPTPDSMHSGFPCGRCGARSVQVASPLATMLEKCGIPMDTPVVAIKQLGKWWTTHWWSPIFGHLLTCFRFSAKKHNWGFGRWFACLSRNLMWNWAEHLFFNMIGVLKSWRCGSVSLKHLQNPKDQCHRNAQRTCLNLKLYLYLNICPTVQPNC